MTRLPDAPWIRDAELNGYPSDDPVKCPVCGQECETLYCANDGDVFGCDQCVDEIEAWKWAEDRREEF